MIYFIRSFLFFLLITFSATLLSDQPAGRYFVVWNVGQGLWTTQIDSECQHFDMGGEFFPLKKISHWCLGRKNKIYLSHWDLDHVGGLKRKKALGTDVCLALAPAGHTSRRKEKLLVDIPICDADPDLKIIRGSANTKNSNDRSHIVLNKGFLLPGDTGIKSEESILIPKTNVSAIKILILGHHGSKTSTSEKLLKQMGSLQMAVASARYARYHHPHPLVAAKLKIHKISLLKTEDWGNIWFEL